MHVYFARAAPLFGTLKAAGSNPVASTPWQGAPLTTDIVSMTGCTEILNDQLVVLIPALWGYPTGVDITCT